MPGTGDMPYLFVVEFSTRMDYIGLYIGLYRVIQDYIGLYRIMMVKWG
jgi:hypothetical protein